ncbi:MAG TPA: hypothetical protein VJN41_01745, partial [Alphaproteobacteria bacterium]|nr:hypothetical protein [Alphaproteobacteria bacterium]
GIEVAPTAQRGAPPRQEISAQRAHHHRPAEALTFVITDEVEPRPKARPAQTGLEVNEAGTTPPWPDPELRSRP